MNQLLLYNKMTTYDVIDIKIANDKINQMWFFFYICQFRVLYNGTQYKEINLDVNDLVYVKKEKTHFLHSLLILQQTVS